MKDNNVEIYKIGLYKIPNNYIKILKENLNISSNDVFELIKINYKNLKELPCVVLIDINEPIPKQLRKYCKENFIQIIRITDRPISIVTNIEIVLSFSSEYLDNEILKDIKQFEYSIEILKKIVRLANISRLKKINESSLNKEEGNKNILMTLIKLIYLIDSKDNYTKLHSLNVAKYAMLLGNELNLEEKDIELLRIGGILHDIGKISIPDYILEKNKELTDTEYEIIKRHPVMGEILIPDEYKKLKEIIRNHHERYDGKGYPDNLKGEEIPYLARILTIADTFDAMTTQRSYNKRKTLEEALNELYNSSRKNIKSGKIIQQLDPNLVDSFILAIKKDKNLIEFFRKEDIKILNNRNKIKILKKTK